MEGTIILGAAIAILFTIISLIIVYILQRNTIRTQQINITSLNDRLTRIQKAHNELRELCKYLQSVREDERCRVAHGIYDEVGQLLAAVKIDISLLNKELLTSGVRNTKISSALVHINNNIGSTINSIRDIVSELRPDVLNHLGLIEAIEWKICAFQHKTGIRCHLQLHCGNVKIDQKKGLVFFRALEEILVVAAQRENVSEVLINLYEENGFLRMKLEDNGDKLDQKKMCSETVLILKQIDERIKSIGGTFDIKGAVEKRMNATIVISKHGLNNIWGD